MAVQRETRQRLAIRSVLRGAKRPLSPHEVLAQARLAVRAVGMATVYRNLKRLVAEGTVHVIHLPGESPRYEPSSLAHHHHFQCTRCDRVFDVPGCKGTLRHRLPSGFTVEHHDVTLYGRCADCKAHERRAPR
ncbi:MAG TPA: transcriptional repressor [Casimicrobiaceae bacterium]|nr:transcriptional repressor [Casimicrobiaceae bacterium]